MKILIDNGHGLDTPGKRSPYCVCGAAPALVFYEWSWNRLIARQLRDKLRIAGYDASLIVPEDLDVPLAQRCKLVNMYADAILVSIHANALGNGESWNSARGWSVYTTPGKTRSDELADCLYSAAKRILPSSIRVREDMSDGDADFEENLFILKNTKCPAVLTENCFFTNVEDTEFLLSIDGQNRIVQLHFEGIVDFLEKRKLKI